MNGRIRTRQLSYVENYMMEIMEIVNNIVLTMLSSFYLKKQDVKVP